MNPTYQQMKKKGIKKGYILLGAVLVMGLTSCNRGYGCPGEINSIAQELTAIADWLTALL